MLPRLPYRPILLFRGTRRPFRTRHHSNMYRCTMASLPGQKNYSTSAPKPIVPYNVRPTDPMRLPALATSPPTSIDTLPPYMNGYYGELQGPPRRETESSYVSLSSGPASSISTCQPPFDLPVTRTAVDMGDPRQRWGEPALVEPQSLYDAQGYDQMRAQIHMGTHMGTDMPPYGYNPSNLMPDKQYG